MRAGIDMEPFECTFCGHNTCYVDWVSMFCDTCGADYSHETTGRIIMGIREKTKTTRPQLGIQLGYQPKTIKNYEWGSCSKKYYEIFKTWTRFYYQNYGK